MYVHMNIRVNNCKTFVNIKYKKEQQQKRIDDFIWTTCNNKNKTIIHITETIAAAITKSSNNCMRNE